MERPRQTTQAVPFDLPVAFFRPSISTHPLSRALSRLANHKSLAYPTNAADNRHGRLQMEQKTKQPTLALRSPSGAKGRPGDFRIGNSQNRAAWASLEGLFPAV